MGVIKGETRSLGYGSNRVEFGPKPLNMKPFRPGLGFCKFCTGSLQWGLRRS